MKASTTRRLLALHRWCGVIVSVNLLVLALSGLILIFHEEIDDALGVMPAASAGAQVTSLSQAVALAQATKPDSSPVFLFQDPDEHPGVAFVGLAEGSRRLDASKTVTVDLRRGEVLTQVDFEGSFTTWVFRLHAELLAGPAGSLLVGLIAVALLVSLVSGAIVYGPLMRRFAFGLLRRDKALRTLIADVHKLLGAATFGWTFVVTATGLLLTLGSTLIQYYSTTELAALGAPYAQEPIVTDLSSVDAAVVSAERAARGRAWSLVALPGSDLASPRHYTVLLRGGEGLDSKMLTLALVDAHAPDQAETHELPAYLKALLLSEPLHFGDYGGLPLKLVWTFFGLLTALLAGSGVWVFATARRRGSRERTNVIDAEPLEPATAPSVSTP